MNVLDFFKNNPQVAGSIAKTIPAIVGMNQAARSKKALYGDGTPENPGYINRLNQIEAQAALKSKQGVTANIEKQEMQNQKLAAQGQQRMEQLQGAGEQIQMNMQENRDLRDINRLQVSADMAQQQRASGVTRYVRY